MIPFAFIRAHPRASAPIRVPRFVLAFLIAASSLAAQAEVTAKDAWVRGTVPAQKTTGAFMTLTSSDDAKLVEASTPVAKRAEIHSSMMMSGVMQMHAVPSVALPAKQAVQLKPGGFHVMLLGLTRPIQAGEQVPITLTIEDAKGARSKLEVKATVRPLGQ